MKRETTFSELLKAAIAEFGGTDRAFAAHVEYSPQYLCEVKNGVHPPSRAFVEACFDNLTLTTKERHKWLIVGARANGWNVPGDD